MQELLEAGAIGPDEVVNHPRGNVITRAVGAELDEFVLDKVSDRLLPGDRFLLCSDGLCKTLPDERTGEPACARSTARRRRRWSSRTGGECQRQRHGGRGRIHRLDMSRARETVDASVA